MAKIIDNGGVYTSDNYINYEGILTFNGDTHIILADGVNMSVDTNSEFNKGDALVVSGGKLAIYAQSTEGNKGSLSAYSYKGSNGIKISSTDTDTGITINGGTVTVDDNTTTHGIIALSNAKSSIIINDGKVNLNVDVTAISVKSSSFADDAAVIAIKGGKSQCQGHWWLQCL